MLREGLAVTTLHIFKKCTARLKEALNVKTDTAAARALGMSQRAFVSRKHRRSFPELKLRALAQRRPDLNLDVDYILTGQHRGRINWNAVIAAAGCAQPHAWAEIAKATGEIVWAAPLAGVELPDWPGKQVLVAYVVLPQAEEITLTLPTEPEAAL